MLRLWRGSVKKLHLGENCLTNSRRQLRRRILHQEPDAKVCDGCYHRKPEEDCKHRRLLPGDGLSRATAMPPRHRMIAAIYARKPACQGA